MSGVLTYLSAFRQPTASGYTLLYDSSSAGGSVVGVAFSDLVFYDGHTLFNDSVRTIGKVTLRLTTYAGTVTGKTYVVKWWTTNGSQDCVSTVATSDDVAGGSWTDQDVDFVFSSPFTTTAATNYNITIGTKDGVADSTNYIALHYITIAASPGTPAPGNLGYGWWGPGSGAPGQFGNVGQTTLIACMKIYTTP